MAQDPDIRLRTSPRIFLVGMAAFLALVGSVVLILYQQIALAFSANPGLNGLILGVLAIGRAVHLPAGYPAVPRNTLGQLVDRRGDRRGPRPPYCSRQWP
jgi:hypothetical protein